MSELPKWASVALLTRCAKLLEPYLVQTWRVPPEGAFDLIAETLRLCADSATAGKDPDSMNEFELSTILSNLEAIAEADASGATGKANIAEFAKHIPEDEKDAKIVHYILEVVAHCQKAARAKVPKQSYKQVVEGLTWAFSAIAALELPELGNQINTERSRLESKCQEFPKDVSTRVDWSRGDWHVSLPRPWWKFWA